jgi:hypothetical protein
VRIVDTLDNVGTKAASPVHLINTRVEGYDHVRSKVSHIWKDKKKKKKAGGGKSGGDGGVRRRPTDWMLEGMIEKGL